MYSYVYIPSSQLHYDLDLTNDWPAKKIHCGFASQIEAEISYYTVQLKCNIILNLQIT